MGNFTPSSDAWTTIDVKGTKVIALKNAELDRFNPEILGLGDLKTASKSIHAVAAVFDLEGFTNFCKQIDPHLAVPAYLGKFVPWLMEQLKAEAIKDSGKEGATLWHPLPFFTKFTGDGLLILWDTEGLSSFKIRNLIISALQICRNYSTRIHKEIKNIVAEPPAILRCGVARGTVFSVGDNADYVGSCINMAARIQKLPNLQFAFNRRGFDLEAEPVNPHLTENFVIKKVSIRGIGSGELIGILKKDWDRLKPAEQRLYKNP
jgi:class 3 adenylate cyclase